MSKVKIIINTCDDYEDVWEMFFLALEDFWPDCPYPIILNTENKKLKLQLSNVTVHNSNTIVDDWGGRLKNTLVESETDFVIMIYDDFILEKKIDLDQILNCINYLENDQNIAAFYFVQHKANVNINDSKFKNFELIPHAGVFKLSSAPAVWRTKTLIKYVESLDTPWAWEFFGTNRTYKNSDRFYCTEKNKNIYNYSMDGAIFRGKWVESVVMPLIAKYNLDLDLSIRGIAENGLLGNKRSFKWKLHFFILGYKMIGLDVLLYLYMAIKMKLIRFLHA